MIELTCGKSVKQENNQPGVVQGRFRMPPGDGNLALAPRDTLVGALFRSWKRALAGLCARLEAGETSSCGLASVWILSICSEVAATRGMKSALEGSLYSSETIFMINFNW